MINDKIDSLTKTFKEKVDSLADDIAAHFSELTSEFSDLKEELTQLITNKYEDLSAEFKEFNKILRELHEYVIKEITSFKTTLGQANLKIITLEKQVLALKIKDFKITESITQLNEKMSARNVLANQNKQVITDLKTNVIEELTSKISTLETIINGDGTPTNPGLKKLSESIPELNRSVDLFSTDITNLNNKVTELVVFKIKYAATSLSLFKEKQGIEGLITNLNAVTRANIKANLEVILADLETISTNSSSDLDTFQLDIVNAIKTSFTKLQAILKP